MGTLHVYFNIQRVIFLEQWRLQEIFILNISNDLSQDHLPTIEGKHLLSLSSSLYLNIVD